MSSTYIKLFAEGWSVWRLDILSKYQVLALLPVQQLRRSSLASDTSQQKTSYLLLLVLIQNGHLSIATSTWNPDVASSKSATWSNWGCCPAGWARSGWCPTCAGSDSFGFTFANRKKCPRSAPLSLRPHGTTSEDVENTLENTPG